MDQSPCGGRRRRIVGLPSLRRGRREVQDVIVLPVPIRRAGRADRLTAREPPVQNTRTRLSPASPSEMSPKVASPSPFWMKLLAMIQIWVIRRGRGTSI